MLRPKTTCIEEMGRNILPCDGTEILDVSVGFIGRGYLANVELKFPFHDFEAANSQIVTLVDIDEVFMLSPWITQKPKDV
jgi:hypothetical protein